MKTRNTITVPELRRMSCSRTIRLTKRGKRLAKHIGFHRLDDEYEYHVSSGQGGVRHHFDHRLGDHYQLPPTCVPEFEYM